MFYLNQIQEPLIFQCFLILFFISFTLCLVIIVSSGYGFTRRAALDETAVQSAHSGFVPRAGGIAIYISIIGLIPLLTFGFVPLSLVFDINTNQAVLFILTALPVFFVGITEDLGYSMPPRRRLIASAISALLVLIIFKVWINQLGILGLDNLLFYSPIGILFTIFATVGVVNAFNLIDGLNGLSSYITISTAIALSIIAIEVNNPQVAIFLVLLTASVSGFMVFNFPFGKIFLGDGGAYLLGHLLVWCSIMLINFDPKISPFAILLIFFWPVADTGLAIWRRWKLGNPADRPDRLHFHQLTMRFLEIRYFGRDKRNLANPFATLILVPLISAPQILGVLFWRDYFSTVLITFLTGLLFVVTYLFGINMAKKSRGSQGSR